MQNQKLNKNTTTLSTKHKKFEMKNLNLQRIKQLKNQEIWNKKLR